MEDKVAKIISGLVDFDAVRSFETNAKKIDRFDSDVAAALKQRANQLGRALVAEKTGLDLSELSPAEEKIVQAAAEYAAIKKREGTNTQRTFKQLANRGLLDAAEVSVSKSKPTQGFQTLADENLAELSYEQIIVDHPEEFSARALWYALRALNLPNISQNPPAKSTTPIQTRTEELLRWLQALSSENGGYFPAYTNADAAAALGMGEMIRHGRAYGNIVSRLDFACYRAGLPPLGLTAATPFAKAWGTRDRDWAYPVPNMQAAAKAHRWTDRDYADVLRITESLPGQAYLIWRQEPENATRSWAFGLNSEKPSGTAGAENDEPEPSKRNKPWTREELILALDLYLRSRTSPFSKDSSEVADISAYLNSLVAKDEEPGNAKFRNINGVYMKMMNFRRFDPEYTSEGRSGLTRGNKLEEVVWDEYADNPELLALAVAAIRSGQEASTVSEQPYWVFVCNPKKWNIDRFLERRIEHDTWGVRDSDASRFAPGQLALVRVGVDERSVAMRQGRPALEAGIYAVCEVESEAFMAQGAADEDWNPGEKPKSPRPTVGIRYLRTFSGNPLTIKRLREEQSQLNHLILHGFQGRSFPISAADFHTIIRLLEVEIDTLPSPEGPNVTAAKLAELEKKYLRANPEVKERFSQTVERGPIGSFLKKAVGFKCQICDALGSAPTTFIKPSGEPYVEAHHVMPVSKLQIGSLAASNVMILCANHHRQLHYGGIAMTINEKSFDFVVNGNSLSISRHGITTDS